MQENTTHQHKFYPTHVRLIHPLTGNFIGEYRPKQRLLISTKHRQTAVIDLNEVEQDYEAFVNDLPNVS